MLNTILFDNAETRTNLLPISYTRPIANIRVGILTIGEKWQQMLQAEQVSYAASPYIQACFPLVIEDDNLFVAGHICPNPALVEETASLQPGEALFKGEELIAFRGSHDDFTNGNFAGKKEFSGTYNAIYFPHDIFLVAGDEIRTDFYRITAGRQSQPLSPTNKLIGNPVDEHGFPQIFIEEGASVEGAVLNVAHGPIYVGKNAEIMEGACIRGSFALCDNSHVNMGCKIYSNTVIGPWSKVGGELNNVVIIGYSNKAHDGFLGNAVIGEWCNLGAGCVASNLKNDYTEIRLWNYAKKSFIRTGLQFCGLIMGDHSKAGINTMFNTATVVGVGCNIHGTGFPRPFIPSFREGAPNSGFFPVQMQKFYQIAERVMARRNRTLTEHDRAIFDAIKAYSSQFE